MTQCLTSRPRFTSFQVVSRVERAVLEQLPRMRAACQGRVVASDSAALSLQTEQLVVDELLRELRESTPSAEQLERGVGVAASSDRASLVAVDPRLVTERLRALLGGTTMTRLPVHQHAQMQAIEEWRQLARRKQQAPRRAGRGQLGWKRVGARDGGVA